MATGVDGAHVLEAEVPLQVRLHEGRHEATAGSIHVDFHIVALHASQTLNSVHWSHLHACLLIVEPYCHFACVLLVELCMLAPFACI